MKHIGFMNQEIESAGIAELAQQWTTGWMGGVPFLTGIGIFLCCTVSRPIQWVPGALAAGVR